MKILYLVNEFDYFRAHRENLATAMADEGHEVVVASGSVKPGVPEGWHGAITLVPLNVDSHRFNGAHDTRLTLEIARLIRREKPDIVHAFTIKPVLYGGLALALSRLRRVGRPLRMIWTFPGLGKIFESRNGRLKSLRRKLVVNALRFVADRFDVIATFENEADRLEAVSQGIVPAERAVRVMGAGIDLNHFQPVPEATGQPSSRDGPLVFLMSSRLINEKGIDTFVQAARHLHDLGIRAEFRLAGIHAQDNPDATDMRLIEKAVSEGALQFLGTVGQADMPALLSACDVVCLPTRLREGFPRALLEAAACGCALIASDQPSIRTLIQPERTGWLLDEPSVDALQDAVSEAVSDPDGTRRFGREALSLVRSLPVSDQAIQKAFADIYTG